MAVGAVAIALSTPMLLALVRAPHVPVWLPALPFALIAISLFGFGLLAWFWSED
jgi:hypothetical protein